MRNPIATDESDRRRDVHGIIGSTLLHGIALGILSLIALTAKAPDEELDTAVSFSDDEGFDEVTVVEADPIENEIVTEELAPTRFTGDFLAQERPADLLADRGIGGVGDGVDALISGVRARVRKAGGKTGDVQFSLAWNDLNDVDLHVIAPSGERISYQHKKSACRGHLDVDMNASAANRSDEPVENTRWPKRRAPSGRYTVLVHLYRVHVPTRDVPYELVVKLGGDVQVLKGKLAYGQKHLAVHRFQFAKPTLSKSRRTTLIERYVKLQETEEKKAGQILEDATPAGRDPDVRRLRAMIQKYPHTDASLQAMQYLKSALKRTLGG